MYFELINNCYQAKQYLDQVDQKSTIKANFKINIADGAITTLPIWKLLCLGVSVILLILIGLLIMGL